MKPIEIVQVTTADLCQQLQQLAAHEGYETPEQLGEALRSGEIDKDSWAAWEYRGITEMLAVPQQAAE